MPFLIGLLAQLKALAIVDSLLELAKTEVNAALKAHATEADAIIEKLTPADVNAFIVANVYPNLKDEYVIKKFGHTFVIPGKDVLTPSVLTLVIAYALKGETDALAAARVALKSAYIAAQVATN